ncbi:sigma-70 family RNA polymerase sigma factor [Fulvivirgaceae bacterium PWU4]|uniref:Sigma-70 family RNA polymerase sigma factor n=1 Tax=Chryseosolibacter histidini TaxID=2782349 RepID=A0AAP2GIF2_9BACT|nr:sigma-70 family RNA polymerase sigma factor [Chryseosolibacter histidini]MBT1697146.1 sigma-70 family RNA polymerase sigma factor [Chryseosolibacter histidini]
MGKTILLREKTGLENLADAEIVERMASRSFDYQRATEAFAEFHRRYAKYLYSLCVYVSRLMPDPTETAIEVTENVLIRVFDYAKSYNPNKASIKTWLSGIARNEFNSYYSDYRREHPLQHPEDEKENGATDSDRKVKFPEENVEIDRSKINSERLQVALDSLEPMAKDIVITHMLYKDIDNLDSQIPPEVMKELCERYNKTDKAIRQIKSRAMAKIKSIMLKE